VKEASYLVSKRKAMTAEAHATAENFMKLCILSVVFVVVNEESRVFPCSKAL
jgi:hypothetical protein